MKVTRPGTRIRLAQALGAVCLALFAFAAAASAETRSECEARASAKASKATNDWKLCPSEACNAPIEQLRADKAYCSTLSDAASAPPQPANDGGCISGESSRRSTTCYIDLNSSCRKSHVCQVDVQTYGIDGKLYSNKSTMRVSPGGTNRYGATGTACGKVSWQCKVAK